MDLNSVQARRHQNFGVLKTSARRAQISETHGVGKPLRRTEMKVNGCNVRKERVSVKSLAFSSWLLCLRALEKGAVCDRWML